MHREDLKQKTKRFALAIVKLVQSMPRSRVVDVIAGQLLRAGTSVGANYRAACRASSTADFVSKMGIVEEAADEALFWMEILIEAEIMNAAKLEILTKEEHQILAMTVSSIRTAKRKRARR